MSVSQLSMFHCQGNILGRYIVSKSSMLVSSELIPSGPSSRKSVSSQRHIAKSPALSFSFCLTTLVRILMQHRCFYSITVSQMSQDEWTVLTSNRLIVIHEAFSSATLDCTILLSTSSKFSMLPLESVLSWAAFQTFKRCLKWSSINLAK